MPRKREFQLMNCVHQTGLWLWLWSIFMIANQCKQTQSTVDNTVPKQVALSFTRSIAEWSSILSRFLLWSLPPYSCWSSFPNLSWWWTITYKLEQTISFPSCFWSWFLIKAKGKNQTKTETKTKTTTTKSFLPVFKDTDRIPQGGGMSSP